MSTSTKLCRWFFSLPNYKIEIPAMLGQVMGKVNKGDGVSSKVQSE